MLKKKQKKRLTVFTNIMVKIGKIGFIVLIVDNHKRYDLIKCRQQLWLTRPVTDR